MIFIYVACTLVLIYASEELSGVFELGISLISHSRKSAHPLAQQAFIPVCQTRTISTLHSCMNVAGENLVLSLKNEDYSKLYFFNWQTGRMKATVSLFFLKLRTGSLTSHTLQPPFPDIDATDFVFLRHDLLLHPTLEGDRLNIYNIPHSTEGGEVRMIQRLLLPQEFRDSFSSVKTRTAPNVVDGDSFPKHISTKRPFLDRPQDAIILLTYHRGPTEMDPPSRIIVHRKSLIKLLPPQSEWSRIDGPMVLEWEEWGPGITHWIENDPAVDIFVTLPYGQRYVHAGAALTILDFNRYYRRKTNHKGDGKSLDPPSGIMGHLPYSLRSSSLFHSVESTAGVFLSETGVAKFSVSRENTQ